MKFILYVTLLFISITGCAQSRYGIIKSYSYFSEFVPGTIPVDDNGVQIRMVDTIYTVFFETKKSITPKWTKAWVNGKTYKVLTTIMATPHIAGINNNTDEQETLNTAKGNQLLQLNLEKIMPVAMPSKYRKFKGSQKVIIEGIHNGQRVYVQLKEPKHLRGKEYQ